MNKQSRISGINGPIIYLNDDTGFKMAEMVYVGNERLIGEVISLTKKTTTIQVFEDTTSLKIGEIVEASGQPTFAMLGPGILNNIFDGIQRPLSAFAKTGSIFINRGLNIDNIDTAKKWDVKLCVKIGDMIKGGDIIATTWETENVEHRVMCPVNISGKVIDVKPNGLYTIVDNIVTIENNAGKSIDICMLQKWPIRIARPVNKRIDAKEPLITGQRILDAMFPIAKGGSAAIPGGFGTGKTMTQHQIAKWADADIIIYIGCGERGNEMTQVLEEFAELIDPRTKRPLMERTVLIANTSNMPVASREASIYTGITLAEYYRDMGYDVAIMADSTSRWAEALRELSGRMEEMPAEEGFPAYLASRLSGFYERSGMVENLNGSRGSVSIIGAVSPQGGDFSEPVTMNTKRFIGCFWGLDKALAYSRHFPAISWLSSYSDYLGELSSWYEKNVDVRFIEHRNKIMYILNQENSLMEIVKLIGADVLPDGQKLVLEIAKLIRVGFLQQNAFHEWDTCVPMRKQFLMMDLILYLYDKAKLLIDANMPMSVLLKDEIFEKITMLKYEIPNDRLEMFDEYKDKVDNFYKRILSEN